MAVFFCDLEKLTYIDTLVSTVIIMNLGVFFFFKRWKKLEDAMPLKFASESWEVY